MSDKIGTSEGLREKFQEALGYWNTTCDQLLAISPAYFAAYLNYLSVPWRHGVLTPKMRELVYITLNASAAHRNASALRLHIANALRVGATEAEIVDVFQIISILGVHSISLSLPILLEEVGALGQEIDVAGLAEQHVEIREHFERSRGYWPASWDNMLALMPDYLVAHEKIGGVSHVSGTIEPKLRELLCIACDAATTHLWASGVRTHTRAALRLGATVSEIVEVLELTAILGTQSVTFGVPILIEEIAKFNDATNAAKGETSARP
jgi:alkylhydroperoxidase/carboxymuconolactone decarboxylase family protein YurZ